MQPVKFLKFLRQFVVLVERNLQLIWNDKLLLASLTLQSPFMVLVVKLTADPNCFTSNLVNIGSRTALFVLAAMATFMGTLNSYREICREREIILREASVGVSLPAVVLSKAAVLLLVEVLQAAILALGFVSIVHVPQNHLLLETDIEIFITVLLTMFSSSCIGLLISALFTSGESAILAVLVLMIGQVVFSNIMFTVTGAAATIFTARRSRVSAWQALGMAVLALLLPFGMNWICLFCGSVVHDLMMYAYIVPLLAALAANERAWNLALANKGKQIGKKTRAAACVLPLAVLTLLFDRGIYANQIYLKKDLEYDTTLSVMTRVVDRIEQVEGYIPGETPVKFLGDIQRSQLAMTRPAFAHLDSLTGTEENYAITYGDTFWMYLEDVMGYPIKRFRETKNEEQERVTDDMPCFPDKDSVQMVDGVVFVKLAAQ